MYSDIIKYGQSIGVVVPNDFRQYLVQRKVGSYLHLSSDDPDFDFRFEVIDKKDPKLYRACPDLGPSVASSTGAQFMFDKASTVFNLNGAEKKHVTYMRHLEAAESVGAAQVLLRFLKRYDEDDEFASSVLNMMRGQEYKVPLDMYVGIVVDGIDLLESETSIPCWARWFELYHDEICSRGETGEDDSKDVEYFSTLTGSYGTQYPDKSGPSIQNVSKYANGSFKIGSRVFIAATNGLNAYEHYGLGGAESVPVSEEDGQMAARCAEAMMDNEATRSLFFARLYWYESTSEEQLEDLIGQTTDVDRESSNEKKEKTSPKKKKAKTTETLDFPEDDLEPQGDDDDSEANDSLQRYGPLMLSILESVYTGKEPPMFDFGDARYHMVKFTKPPAVQGRALWTDDCVGSYNDLARNVYKWVQDTCMSFYSYKQMRDVPKSILNVRTMEYLLVLKQNATNIDKQISAEFGSNVEASMFHAVFEGAPVSYTLFYHALTKEDGYLLLPEKSADGSMKTRRAQRGVHNCAIRLIKAYLIRKECTNMALEQSVNMTENTTAYAIGRLMAVCEKVQIYHFGAQSGKKMSRQPGRLLSQTVARHLQNYTRAGLAKMLDMTNVYLNGSAFSDNRWLREKYENEIGAITRMITDVPVHMSTIQRGEFFCGYYQEIQRQNQERDAKRREKAAAVNGVAETININENGGDNNEE